jgi:predicted nucleic acid-binding protein
MSLATQLQNVHQVFLDTAVVIYFVEKNPTFSPRLQNLFDRFDTGELEAVVSPITLAECLVFPYKLGKPETGQVFIDLLVNSENVWFYPLDEIVAEKAAELRARYNLTLTDAFQLAAAIQTDCDAFVTNDMDLKRVSEIPVVVISE